MKRYLKNFGVAFLAGVGAARVLIWLNMGIVHLLVMQGGWEAAAAVKAAPWILFALGGGLAMSLYGMYEDCQRYKRSSPYGRVQHSESRHSRPQEPEYRQNRRDA